MKYQICFSNSLEQDHLNLVKCQKVRGMGKKLGELRGRKVKADYHNEDFYKIRIIKFLSDHEEARVTDFLRETKYGINSKKTLIRLLGEMTEEDKWINKTVLDQAKNVKIYTLAEKGHKMKNFIQELQENESDHPLFDCKLYSGIKSLD